MRAVRLFLELEAGNELGTTPATCAAADGIVIPRGLAPHAVTASGSGCRILEGCSPGEAPQWVGHEGAFWVSDRGLDACAGGRDRWPDAAWVPRARVYRPAPRFDFRPGDHDEGFKTYMPDLATYRSHRVAGEEMELRDWLARAAALGFATAWLHGVEAAARGRGHDLDMLERASANFTGRLWISGGAELPRHLESLATQGGADAVIVPLALACEAGVPALRTALCGKLPVMSAAPAGAPPCARPA